MSLTTLFYRRANVISSGARPNPHLFISTSSINPGEVGAGFLLNKRVDSAYGVTQLFEGYPGSDPRNSLGFSVSIPLFTRYYYEGDEGEIRRAEVDLQFARNSG